MSSRRARRGSRRSGSRKTPLAAVAEGWLTSTIAATAASPPSNLIDPGPDRREPSCPILTIILLGIVEGVTEFLPVSSTGHLILATALLGYDENHWKVFNVVIQLGAILAVVVLYWRTFLGGARWAGPAASRIRGASCATSSSPSCPSAIGLLLHKQIEAMLGSPTIVSVALIVGGLAILVIERLRTSGEERGVADIRSARRSASASSSACR
jgi:undecaprenyl pyrophosphate phosphatase UppP